MAKGIAPSLLRTQVESTCAWALQESDSGFAAPIRDADALDARYADTGDVATRLAYLRLMLAAHHATVATIVPTDVDSHIRFHFWQSIDDADALRAALDVVDETQTWDVRAVSNRFVDLGDDGLLSGHDGEWLAVRAGALGRALALGDAQSIERIVARLDGEVAREERGYSLSRAVNAGERKALCIATVIAHNLGDLSRVVEAWPRGVTTATAADVLTELRSRFTRLGHDPRSVLGEAGRVNKALMADENHRYLPLRAARSLRRSRELVIPFGPFFDSFGTAVGSSPLLDGADRADVLGVLLDAHAASPTLLAYPRALAGLEGSVRGGLDRLARDHLPARARKQLLLQAIRDAIRTPEAALEARVAKRFRTLCHST